MRILKIKFLTINLQKGAIAMRRNFAGKQNPQVKLMVGEVEKRRFDLKRMSSDEFLPALHSGGPPPLQKLPEAINKLMHLPKPGDFILVGTGNSEDARQFYTLPDDKKQKVLSEHVSIKFLYLLYVPRGGIFGNTLAIILNWDNY